MSCECVHVCSLLFFLLLLSIQNSAAVYIKNKSCQLTGNKVGIKVYQLADTSVNNVTHKEFGFIHLRTGFDWVGRFKRHR